jgi:class 3 adenylate cyclase
MNTILNVPILVNGGKVAGCLNIGEKAEHAFSEHDRILVKDIAATLGSHIYSKRLQRAEQEAHRVSKELLDSMIPPKVLSKIEHFWGSEARSSTVSKANSMDNSFVGTPDLLRQISVKQDKTDRKERFKQIESRLKKLQSISADDVSTNFVCDIHANPNLETVPFEPSVSMKPFATSPQTTSLEGDPVKVVGVDDEAEQRALYAEERRHTSIIFTDIVGFSRISLKVRPIQVMDMLQSLFYRFDKLCDVHGVLKLETVGDAYLVSSGLLDDDTDEDAGRAHAIRALNMAKDMVQQAQKVMAPRTNPSDPVEFLEIRVGIHVGDMTCGILGQNLPKFSVFGNG